MFQADDLEKLGRPPQPDDSLIQVTGVGGQVWVLQGLIDTLEVQAWQVSPCPIQIASFDFEIPMDAILGLDFLMAAGLVVDLKKLGTTPSLSSHL